MVVQQDLSISPIEGVFTILRRKRVVRSKEMKLWKGEGVESGRK